jgi:hypothetical protein
MSTQSKKSMARAGEPAYPSVTAPLRYTIIAEGRAAALYKPVPTPVVHLLMQY